MPRRIPPSTFPARAAQDYFAALRREIRAWIAALADNLLALSSLRTDAIDPALDALLQQQLAATRQANEQLRRRLASQQVDQAVDAARDRWKAAEQRLSQGIASARSAVDRVSARNVERQIAAAASNRRYQIGIGAPPFGAEQAVAERFTRENIALLKDVGEKAARDLETLVQDVVGRGGSPSEIKQAIAHTLKVTEKRAALIAEHQCGRLEANLSNLRASHAGAVGFVWQKTVSSKPRGDHLENVGKTFPMDHSPKPRELPNCKCSYEYVFQEAPMTTPDPLQVQLERVRQANERLRRSAAKVAEQTR